MDGSGEDNRRSISDEIAAKITYSTTMRALCFAWLYPAISLVWAGFGSLGLRPVDDVTVRAGLDQAQAVAVLLVIFTTLVGGIWAVRTWPYLPASAFSRTRSRWNGPLLHGAALPVAAVAVLGSLIMNDRTMPLVVLGGAAGCLAGFVIPRWLLQAPLDRSFPIAVFSGAAVMQVTLGWAPILSPDGVMALIIVIDGLALAWAAVAAARSIPVDSLSDALTPAAVGLPVGTLRAATTTVEGDGQLHLSGDDGDGDVDLISPVPARPSLREPAVGH